MKEVGPARGGLPSGRVGNYEITRRLGAGGMGEVYLGRDVSLHRPVALKVLRSNLALDAQLVERFHREARAAAQLNHPHIVQIYAVGAVDGIPHIAMEYVEGSPLDTVLREHGALPWQRALNITSQIASALELAHSRGIIHRDIKPANILIDRQGRARVTDFGVAKVIGAGTQLTTDGALIGTPEYMSPEQCGIGQIGPASDLFSLGAMLYEMMTGSLPFTGETYAGVIRSVTQDTPRALDELVMGIPQSVVFIVAKLLEKDPARRYRDAPQLLADLARVAAGNAPTIEIPAQSASALPMPKRTSGSALTPRNMAIAAGALVLVAAVAAVGLRARPSRNDQPTSAAAQNSAAPPQFGPEQPPPPEGGEFPPQPGTTDGARGPLRGRSAQDVITAHDTNRDGMIQASEAPAQTRGIVMRADTNRDNVVTLHELETAMGRRAVMPARPGFAPPRDGIGQPPPPEGAPGFPPGGGPPPRAGQGPR